MLEVIKASGGYGKTTIIRDVSLRVAAGEMVGLLGRNGVGKTTLMRYIVGLISASAGEVRINGKPAPKSPNERAWLGIGYVPQGRFVFPRMTVSENIAVAAVVNNQDAHKMLEQMLEYFPILKPKLKALAGSLSGGQQQILAIARAMATAPKIILLDEPTEGVQPSLIEDMLEILKRFNIERGTSILVAEQNLDFCMGLAQRAYIMSSGSIKLEADRDKINQDKDLQQELLGV